MTRPRCHVCHATDVQEATAYPDGWTGERIHVCSDVDGRPSTCAEVLERRVVALERDDG